MKIEMKKTVDVDVVSVRLFAKLRDEGSYTFYDQDGEVVKELNDCYVPSIFPEEFGDYIDLLIDLDTGRIMNWNSDAVSSHLDEIINGDD